jgi:hypothetical protein
MTKEKRHQEFLNKAKEADERAEKARDPQARSDWKVIAQSYRELAANTGREI